MSAREKSRKRFLDKEIQRDHYAGDTLKSLAEISKMPFEETDKRKTDIEEKKAFINKRGVKYNIKMCIVIK